MEALFDGWMAAAGVEPGPELQAVLSAMQLALGERYPQASWEPVKFANACLEVGRLVRRALDTARRPPVED